MKTKTQPYDIIGDIHGHADTLRALLGKLGYVERGGVYRHPSRTAIFVGDFIDRGPKIQETLQIVKAMTDAGTASAIMGNHEHNALCFFTEDGRGGHLLSRTVGNRKNEKGLRATLDQIAIPFPKQWAAWLDWFKTLPLFLDLGDLRIVHACWDAVEIAVLGGKDRLNDELMRKSVERGTPEHRAIRVLLKGKDIPLPDGHVFTTRAGDTSHAIRVRWWLGGEGHTYDSLCLPPCETVPQTPVSMAKMVQGSYPATEPPVIFGHYWLPPARPEPLAPNVACVDFSVTVEGGMLVCYRWDGERELDPQKFVSVSRAPSVE